MIFSFQPTARKELIDAIIWHEQQRAELGVDFSEQVFSGIDEILSFPESRAIIDNKGHRKYLISRFHYGIIYKYYKKKQLCVIVAIAHDRHRPDYWKDRI
jgi:plasmid stabilization system protein ParE